VKHHGETSAARKKMGLDGAKLLAFVENQQKLEEEKEERRRREDEERDARRQGREIRKL